LKPRRMIDTKPAMQATALRVKMKLRDGESGYMSRGRVFEFDFLRTAMRGDGKITKWNAKYGRVSKIAGQGGMVE
jgi:hypothetical protein